MKYPTSLLLLLIIASSSITQKTFSQQNDSVNIRSLIFARQYKTDSVLLKNRGEFIDKLMQLNFNSGIVRFSGAGFPDVVSTELKNTTLAPITLYLDQCRFGSQITFEKCLLKNVDGTISGPINKAILIQ